MNDSTQNVRFHVKSHVTKHMFRWTITAKCYVKFHVTLSSMLSTNISRYQTWVLRVISTKITKSHVTKLDVKWNVKVNVKDNVKVNVRYQVLTPVMLPNLTGNETWNDTCIKKSGDSLNRLCDLMWKTFCHSSGVNSIKTNLQTCHWWTGQYSS